MPNDPMTDLVLHICWKILCPICFYMSWVFTAGSISRLPAHHLYLSRSSPSSVSNCLYLCLYLYLCLCLYLCLRLFLSPGLFLHPRACAWLTWSLSLSLFSTQLPDLPMKTPRILLPLDLTQPRHSFSLIWTTYSTCIPQYSRFRNLSLITRWLCTIASGCTIFYSFMDSLSRPFIHFIPASQNRIS